MKILIIGAVAAGLKSASKARREDGKAEITVLERGKLISYGACGMPYFVGGEVHDIKELMATGAGNPRNAEYFKKTKNIDVHTETEAVKIDRDQKMVVAKDLKTGELKNYPYDKLVIATGASPVRPPLEGIGLRNIFTLWHPDDAVAIRSGIDGGTFKNAVIIGAGLIGMEMAEALNHQGLNVTVVEMKDQIFPAFLDEDIAAIGHKYLKTKNIQLLTGEKVEGLLGTDSVTTVKTDQREIPADLVIMAIGARPNVGLAKDAGLTIGETGAIWVDETMRTSDPEIFAGGDCVESTNMVNRKKVFAPMGSIANKQGRVIGENLLGGKARFKGVASTVVVKIHDITIGKTGLSEKEAKDQGYDYVTALIAGPDRPHYMKNARPVTLKLIVDSKTQKVLGVQGIGEGEVAKRIDVVAAVLNFGGTIDDLFDIDLSYAPPYNSPIDMVATAANTVMNKLANKFTGISAAEAKEKVEKKEAIFLDVRTPGECQNIELECDGEICQISLGELRARMEGLDKDQEIIAFCKLGQRGYEAQCILREGNITNVKVMEGGIIAWPYCCKSMI